MYALYFIRNKGRKHDLIQLKANGVLQNPNKFKTETARVEGKGLSL